MRRTLPPAAGPNRLRNLLHAAGGALSGARALKRFEGELKEYFGVRHVFPVSSGKTALFVILRALKALSPERSTVVIPAYTCFSVPSAVIKAGLDVKLCDMDRKTMDFDYNLLADAIGKDTLCVVPGNLFGIPSDVERVRRLCGPHGAFVVEDAAQAMGVRYKGRLVGTAGDAGFFSLARGKNITCGSGGVIVTDSDRVGKAVNGVYSTLPSPGAAETLKEFLMVVAMDVFINPSFYWLPSGLPFLKLGETRFYRDFPVERLSGMKAGLLRNWRTELEWSNRVRAENAEYFRRGLGLRDAYGRTPLLRLPVVLESAEARERVCSIAKGKGLGVSRMYPSPVNEIEEIKERFSGEEYPGAKTVAERLVTIPTHHLLKDGDRAAIRELFLKTASCPAHGQDAVRLNTPAKPAGQPRY
ncbi:MAG: DegT/DnrJ/EryC1/StrS family aminotransferase [Deltaproteobacteria bacterium]|nr:DegT/DnrJ/EryC1/StrS family aminotransferase [Deltaproteobacteria bacterium]